MKKANNTIVLYLDGEKHLFCKGGVNVGKATAGDRFFIKDDVILPILEVRKSHTNRELVEGVYTNVRYLCVKTRFSFEWIKRSELLIDMGHYPELENVEIGTSVTYHYAKGVKILKPKTT